MEEDSREEANAWVGYAVLAAGTARLNAGAVAVYLGQECD